MFFRIVLLLLLPWLAAAGLAEEKKVSFLHYNDVYQIAGVGEKGGFARLATVTGRLRKVDPFVFSVLSGDFLSPSLLSGLFQGRQMMELLNASSVGVASLGNHEFDLGYSVLKERLAEANFPVLASDLTEKGQPLPGTRDHFFATLHGVKVGFFSLIDPAGHRVFGEHPELGLQPPKDAALRWSRNLREAGAELVVAVTHLDFDQDRELAASIPGIDLILGGHDHVARVERVGPVTVVKSGTDLELVSWVTMTRPAPDAPWETAVETFPLDGTVTPDPALAARVTAWEKKAEPMLSRLAGRTATELDARDEANRTRETGLGNLVADASREKVGAEIAFVNGGGIRSNRLYPPGEISLRDLHAILPFGNRLVLIELTGEAIRAALEVGVSSVEKVKGFFLQVSGVSFRFDPARPPGRRVLEATVAGAPLDPKHIYKVAINDYLAQGGDGYDMFAAAPRLLKDGPILVEALESYWTARGEVAPRVEGRIRQP